MAAPSRRSLPLGVLLFLIASSLAIVALIGAHLRNDPPDESSSPLVGLSNTFPSIDDTIEMAALSYIVYSFRDELDNEAVCRALNSKNFSMTEDQLVMRDTDAYCHFYNHSRSQGTQVMIVSSKAKQYNAVVFCGTDDFQTSLVDADIMLKAFGNSNVNVTLPTEELRNRVRVHAGFDNAVFSQDIFNNILEQWEMVRAINPPDYRLFTTGHSLGAANAVLTAVALTLRYNNNDTSANGKQQRESSWTVAASRLPQPWKTKWWHHWSRRRRGRRGQQHQHPMVTCINFGCPRIGNSYWRDFVHSSHPSLQHLAIWRFVLGWDLVPRLPKFMTHTGHTIQLYNTNDNTTSSAGINNSTNATTAGATAKVYYHHYGNESLHLAGVPFGWYSTPFIWVPGALASHHMFKYWSVLREWQNSSLINKAWIGQFVKMDENNNDDRPPNVDDDFWVDPPDNDAAGAVE
jgi:hypothetical protein